MSRCLAAFRATCWLALAPLALATAALAQSPITVQVTSLADGPATPGTCGSIGLPTCTLRDAIAFAAQQGASTPVTIAFAPGLTASSTQAAPAVITLLFGQLELTRALTITGPGADLLQISGNLGGTGTASRVLQIDGGVTANISGLTFTKGNGTGSTNSGTGGAIYCAGALNLTDSTISNSSASAGSTGGGLTGYYSTAITLTRVTVAGNTASRLGGGIDVEGNTSTLAILNSTVTGNSLASAPFPAGGGLYFNGAPSRTALTLINSTVTANSVVGALGSGGGIFINNSINNQATFTESIVAGNTAGSNADVDGTFTDGGGNVAPTSGSASGTAPYTAATLLLPPLGYYGGHTQTMPALPASPALCSVVNSINSTIPAGLPATDQRGNPRIAKYGSVSCLDAGAVQTQYSIGSASPSSGYTDTPGALISPSPAVTFLESGNNINFSETNANGANIGTAFGTLSGTLTQTNVTNGNVSFPGLSLNTNAVADNLTYQAFLTYQNFDSNINISANGSIFQVTQPALSPSLSTFVANPTSLPVGASSTLTVTILSVSGTPLANVGVGFSPVRGGGTVTMPNGSSTNANGQLTAQLTDSRAETDILAAVAVVNGPGTDLNQSATVTFTPPVYTVTSLADATGGTCTAGSTTDANCTLRAAVAAANAVAGGGATIQFASALAGTQAAPNTITLINGVLNLTRSTTIQGPGANLLSISGNYGGTGSASQVLQIAAGVTANVSGLTLTRGNATGSGNNAVGGAITNQGTLNLTDSTISASLAGVGGGLYSNGTAINLIRVAIINNTSVFSAAGIFAAGGTLSIANSTISGNINNGSGEPFSPVQGGGIYDAGASTVTISNSTITGNKCLNPYGNGAQGGGLYIYSGTGVGPVSLTDTIIAGNTATTYPDEFGTYTDNGGNIAPASNSSTGQAPYTAATLLLAPLGFYGGPTQTMLPLPGSPAICAGLVTGTDGTPNPAMDQRGFSHSPQYCTGGSQQDTGAVQTGYALAFTTQPGNSLVSQPIAGLPAVLLTEQQNPFMLAAETVNFAINSGTLSNTSATTSTMTGIATLTASDNTAGAADTLSASVTVAPAGASPTTTATATSNTFSETPVVVSANSSVVASPTQVFVTQPSTITVTVTSTSGAPIANATVTVSSTNHGAFIQNSGSTNANGAIAFQLTDATPETDVISASVTYNGASTTLTQTATVTFQAPIFTVNTLADDATGVAQNCIASSNAPCTLRDAVAASNSVSTAGNVMQFAPALAGTQAAPNTITLTNGQLELTKSVSIQGPGANLLQVSGNNRSNIFQIDSGVTAGISSLTLTKALGASAGAITNGGTLLLTDAAVTNSNGTAGAALLNSSVAILTRVTLSGNTSSGSGGAIYTQGTSLQINDSTIAGNTAHGFKGAGIYVASGQAVLTATTVTGNSTDNGGQDGGIFGPVTLSNSIVAGNSTGQDGSYADLSTPTNNGGSLYSTNTSGTSAINPLLAPLAYYGGPTQTMPPLPNSPAICAGLVTGTNGTANPATDQRGNSHSTQYCSSGQLDSGSVQTSYSSAFSTLPGNSFVNQPLTGPVAVTVTESGNVFTGAPVSVSLALGLGNGTLTNNVAQTAAGTGIATFSTASISAPGTGDVLSEHLTSFNNFFSTSNAFEVIGPASQTNSTFTLTSNSIQLSGFTNAVVVLKDSVGDTVAVAGTTVYFAVTGPSPSTQNANSQARTDATGTATDLIDKLQAGTYTVAAFLDNAHTQQIGSTQTLTVLDPATSFSVSGATSPAALQQADQFRVLALDSMNAVAATFAGKVTITSSDPLATLPAPYTFVPATDHGFHYFNIAFGTPGTQTITATSTSGGPNIMGTETGVLVTGSTWIVNSNGTVSRLNGAGTVLATAGTTSSTGTFGGIAIDNGGDAWAVLNVANSLMEVGPAGTLTGTFTGAGINTPVAVAIDGQGQVWVANANNSVSEFTNAGTPVSPATGYGATTTGQPTPFNTPSSIAIDQTGSIWITNSGNSTITRIFGSAAPVVAPLVTGTTNGTTGTRP